MESRVAAEEEKEEEDVEEGWDAEQSRKQV